MNKSNNINLFVKDLADTIREVSGKTDPINPQNFSNEIRKLTTTQIPVSLKSTATLSEDQADKIRQKQRHLYVSVSGTTINGEEVYKLDQKQNQDSFSLFDTLFYTKEGDSNGYYYLLNTSDNYLSKENLIYDVNNFDDVNTLINTFKGIRKNGYKMKMIETIGENTFKVTFEDNTYTTLDRVSTN